MDSVGFILSPLGGQGSLRVFFPRHRTFFELPRSRGKTLKRAGPKQSMPRRWGGWNMVKLGNLKTWMALDGWIPRKIITRNQTWQWTPPIYRWCSHWNLHLYWMFHCHVWLPEGKQLHVGGSSMLIHTTFGTRGHDRSLWNTWMSKVQSSMANGCLGLLGSHHIWWRTIFIIYKSIKSIYLAITPSSCLSI